MNRKIIGLCIIVVFAVAIVFGGVHSALAVIDATAAPAATRRRRVRRSAWRPEGKKTPRWPRSGTSARSTEPVQAHNYTAKKTSRSKNDHRDRFAPGA